MPTNTSSSNTASSIISRTSSEGYVRFLIAFVNAISFLVITASTAMKSTFPAMMDEIIHYISRAGKAVVFTQATMNKLHSTAAGSDPQLAAKAQAALNTIKRLTDAQNAAKSVGLITTDFIRFTGNPSCTDEAEAVLRLTADRVWSESFGVLTQDGKLREDLEAFNNFKSTKMEHHVQVKRISEGTQLQDFSTTPPVFQQPQRSQPTPVTANSAAVEAFLRSFGVRHA